MSVNEVLLKNQVEPLMISREVKRNSVNSEYAAQTAQRVKYRKSKSVSPVKSLYSEESYLRLFSLIKFESVN